MFYAKGRICGPPELGGGGGASGTYFNVCESGWMERPHFLEWFKKLLLPAASSILETGPVTSWKHLQRLYRVFWSLKKAVEELFEAKHLKTGFRKAGLLPLTTEPIAKSSFALSSTHTTTTQVPES